MKETARNAIPINGIIKNTGFPCYELYVTKSLFLTTIGVDRAFAFCHSERSEEILPWGCHIMQRIDSLLVAQNDMWLFFLKKKKKKKNAKG